MLMSLRKLGAIARAKLGVPRPQHFQSLDGALFFGKSQRPLGGGIPAPVSLPRLWRHLPWGGPSPLVTLSTVFADPW